tara:strand:- start:392 stop:565 length:174 start_codon:yes stop_codon:yes gene_type:complete
MLGLLERFFVGAIFNYFQSGDLIGCGFKEYPCGVMIKNHQIEIAYRFLLKKIPDQIN